MLKKRSEKIKYVGLIKDDILIVLLDMIAIYAAYFLALMLCFFGGGHFNETLSELPYQYSRFAPYSTVICMIVFYIFRLYGGMWRYAGRNDISRVIGGATVVTSVFPITGTLHFLRRMPVAFYSIGMILTEDKQSVHAQSEKKSIAFRNSTSFLAYKEYESFDDVKEEPQSWQEENRFISFSPPDISDSEVREVAMTLQSGWITTGPRTKLLERRLAAYIDTGNSVLDTEQEPDRWNNRVVCLNSSTAAEELNLRILGIRDGDEVIVPAYTYTASASAAIHCGATVKFIDIQKDGDQKTHMPEMDYAQLEAAVTSRTKAIITVDLGGIVCDYDKIFEIVMRKKNIFCPLQSDSTPLGELSSRIQKSMGRIAVVADCAHSLGASRVYKGEKTYCGNIADFSSFSFHAVKNFTTGEGGAGTWKSIKGIDNKEIYTFYQLLSLHGQNKDALAKSKAGAWEYDIVGPWYKCNMTDIMAAIGLRQLDRYQKLLVRREEIIKRYDAVCDELGLGHLCHHTEEMDSSNHLYLIRIPEFNMDMRNQFIEKMYEHGVATNVHYKPLPMMTGYRNLGWDIKDFPNSFAYYENLVSIPLHTLLTDSDIDHVCNAMRDVIKEFRNGSFYHTELETVKSSDE